MKSDIKELVSDVYNQFTSPDELKGIDLQLTVPEQELVSTVDREKLSKILVNLMGNAIKYAHAHIDLKLVVTDKGYEIQVNDDGPGILRRYSIRSIHMFQMHFYNISCFLRLPLFDRKRQYK